jgi:hypothetical protein
VADQRGLLATLGVEQGDPGGFEGNDPPQWLQQRFSPLFDADLR